ncbi:MAG: hypothetical protein ACE5JX_19720 [Acidobacteriota bacterium]
MKQSIARPVTPLAVALTLMGAFQLATAQPKLKISKPTSYLVGDTVDGNTLVLTKDLEPRKLSEIVQSDARVVVLVILGGAAPTAPDYHPLRGGLWCPDSFDDLPLQRALMRHFKDAPVQFVAVATTPAYSDVYGFAKDVFLTRPDDDPLLVSQVRTFIELTEKTKKTDVLPYREIYYDPKFRLAQDKKRELGPNYGTVYPWQGKLRWHLDPRKYGTPTLWILDGHLKVLREPFTGNNYNDDPPQIQYGFQDVKDAIQRFLE